MQSAFYTLLIVLLVQGHSWHRRNHSFSRLGKKDKCPVSTLKQYFCLWDGSIALLHHPLSVPGLSVSRPTQHYMSLENVNNAGLQRGNPSSLHNSWYGHQSTQISPGWPRFYGNQAKQAQDKELSPPSSTWQSRQTLSKKKSLYFLEKAVWPSEINGSCQKGIPLAENIGIYLS